MDAHAILTTDKIAQKKKYIKSVIILFYLLPFLGKGEGEGKLGGESFDNFCITLPASQTF